MIFLTGNIERITRHPPPSCFLLKPASCYEDIRLPLLFRAGSHAAANSGERAINGDLPQAQCFVQISEVFLILGSSQHIWLTDLKPQSASQPLAVMKVIFWLTYLLFCFTSHIVQQLGEIKGHFMLVALSETPLDKHRYTCIVFT